MRKRSILSEQPSYMHCFIYQNIYILIRGMPWHSWLRHCATSRMVADLTTDGIIEVV